MDVILLLRLHGPGIWGFGEVKSWGAGGAGEPSPRDAHPGPRAAEAAGLLLAPSLSPWVPKATPWAVPFLPYTPSRRQSHWEQPVCHHCVCPTPLEMARLARSILVTGSNRGIGLELVRQLAASSQPPQHIFATCRDAAGPRGKVSAWGHLPARGARGIVAPPGCLPGAGLVGCSEGGGKVGCAHDLGAHTEPAIPFSLLVSPGWGQHRAQQYPFT